MGLKKKKKNTNWMKSLDTHLGLKSLESHWEHEERDNFDIDGDPLNGQWGTQHWQQEVWEAKTDEFWEDFAIFMLFLSRIKISN